MSPQDKFSFFVGGTTIFTGRDLSPLLRPLDIGLNIAKTKFLQGFFACVPEEKFYKSGTPRRAPVLCTPLPLPLTSPGAVTVWH